MRHADVERRTEFVVHEGDTEIARVEVRRDGRLYVQIHDPALSRDAARSLVAAINLARHTEQPS